MEPNARAAGAQDHPSLAAIQDAAEALGFHVREADLEGYARAVQGTLESSARVDELYGRLRATEPILAARTSARPLDGENPHNAWASRTSIVESTVGPLAGRRVAVKDTIAVRGLPMTAGSRLLGDFVPSIDAEVVSRLLAAGAEIAGTATCEDLGFSGHSFTSTSGPVTNPWNTACTTGGSSSGCAVLVAIGAVDVAIGADQGGSVTQPAAWTGICGLKPTFGLVPYSGALPVEMTVDHLGPMARTVAELTETLQVIAGPDGADPRQGWLAGRAAPEASGSPRAPGDIDGLRVGLLEEGFDWPGRSDARVDRAVREAAGRLASLGCTVDSVSVPAHRDARHVFGSIMAPGSTSLMRWSGAQGENWRGSHWPELRSAVERGWVESADSISMSAKANFIAGQYLGTRAESSYSRAQVLARSLADAVDRALAYHDVLVLPTQVTMPPTFPEGDLPADEFMRAALGMSINTCAFNLTGHPVLSVPCGIVDGLPVGMLIVARRGADATALQVGHAFETRVFRMPPAPGFRSGSS